MTSRLHQGIALLVVVLAVACKQKASAPTEYDGQSLDGPDVGYVVQGDEFAVVDHQHRGTNNNQIIAITKRPLTRPQLLAIARHLAGRTTSPSIGLMVSEAAREACGRARFDVLRGGADPADSQACTRGTLLWMDSTEPRIFHWGLAAPRSDEAAPEANGQGAR